MDSSSMETFQPSQHANLSRAHILIQACLDSDVPALNSTGNYVYDPKKFPEGQSVLEYADSHSFELIAVILERHTFHNESVRDYAKKNNMEWHYGVGNWHSDKVYEEDFVLNGLFTSILLGKPHFDAQQLDLLLSWFDAELAIGSYWRKLNIEAAVSFYASVAPAPVPDALRMSITRLAMRLLENSSMETHEMYETLMVTLNTDPSLPIASGEAWADIALEKIGQQTQAVQRQWSEFIAHCRTASAGKPSRKWLLKAQNHIAILGELSISEFVLHVFPAVAQSRTAALDTFNEHKTVDPNLRIGPGNSDILKGLAWCCPSFSSSEIADALADLAASSYKKIPGLGPRATKIGNSCVWALGEIEGDTALTALAMLKVRVQFLPAQKGIAKALQSTAERAGLSTDELEEIGVPAFGMEDVGIRREVLGDYQCKLVILPVTGAQLQWQSLDGKSLKSIPKAVRENHGDELRDLKRVSNDVNKMLVAQKQRLDSLYVQNRDWLFNDWRCHYLDHPLIGTLARRLIWHIKDGVTEQLICWHDGALQAICDSNPKFSDSAKVRLWHPMQSEPQTILAARDWLMMRKVIQPFKQAHREVYVLTDVERQSSVYSNRYAGHILKQHQFNALCGERGWYYRLRMMVDDSFPPAVKYLPTISLRAEYWVHGAGNNFDTDVLDSGAFRYINTDQLRFYPLNAQQHSAHSDGSPYQVDHGETASDPILLKDIPPLILSEVLRDIDLFTAVASVGNDPYWLDGGETGARTDYWHDYSLGELDKTAMTRRDLFEQLLPKLDIANQCRLDGRWLHVEGQLNHYKIHLGSATVLIEPEGKYLCIVKAGSHNDLHKKIYLPFEGDSRTAEILSKAILLANDKGITDKLIFSQL